MIEIKRKKIGKRELTLIITASILVLLITAYIVIAAVLNSLDKGSSGAGGSHPDDIIAGAGEALYGTSAVAYPYIAKSSIQSISVGSHKDKFAMVRPTDDEGKPESYFVFYYEDENGNPTPYLPDIVFEEEDFDYTDFYAKESSDGLNVYKIDYLCAAIGAMYFNDRIALSSDTGEREAQLNRFGLGSSDRETIAISYLDADGNSKEHTVYIGDKLITGTGYYFQIKGRDYVYCSTASERLSYALGGFESFLHSRVVAEGLTDDGTYGPFYTPDYSQWKNVYYNEEGALVLPGSEVIVSANTRVPIYTSVAEEGDDVDGKGTGYRPSGISNIRFDLSSLTSPEFSELVSLLSSMKIGEGGAFATVVLNQNSASLFDGEKGRYEYTVYGIEEILNRDASTQKNTLVVVEYDYKIDGSAKTNERCHAVIDLTKNSAIPSEIRNALASEGKGELSSPLSFEICYNEENAEKRSFEYRITSVSLIYEIEQNTVNYLDKVAENSIVTYTYKLFVDGRDTGILKTETLPLAEIKEGYYLKIKEALVGAELGNVAINVTDEMYCQPFESFVTYEIEEVLGFIKAEKIVSFRYANPSERNPFYGESIYKNTLDSSDKNSIYAMNDRTCDTVLGIFGGVTQGSSSQFAEGLVGSETVAVGLTHSVMEKYKLYDGHKIRLVLPRLITEIKGTEDFTWHDTIEFVLYISDNQPDGTRFIGSEMYDIVVKIDGSTFDFLEKSFVEHWARRNLVMVQNTELNSVKVELNMKDVYGSYEFDIDHKPAYIVGGIPQFVKPESGTYTEYTYSTVTVRPLTEERSESAFSTFLISESREEMLLENVYNRVAGYGVTVGYDTAGTSNFKDMLFVLYSTSFLGIVPEAEQVKSEESRLMSIAFALDDDYSGTYYYDFYRLDDRRVMVSMYTLNSNGNKVSEASDFYISTFAFKKIVRSYECLLNGVSVNSGVGYEK